MVKFHQSLRGRIELHNRNAGTVAKYGTASPHPQSALIIYFEQPWSKNDLGFDWPVSHELTRTGTCHQQEWEKWSASRAFPPFWRSFYGTMLDIIIAVYFVIEKLQTRIYLPPSTAMHKLFLINCNCDSCSSRTFSRSSSCCAFISLIFFCINSESDCSGCCCPGGGG